MTPDQCLVVIATGLLGGTACAWQARRAFRAWRHDDYRTRNDRRQAWLTTSGSERPEPAAPGTDSALYLNCIAIYGDCQELDRLRDAIDQHRKEQP